MKNVKPQNLLILFSDQHSKEKLGCYGNEFIQTPNLDALAKEGTMFTSAYTNNPICCPARASMATGNYCHSIKCWDNAHPYAGAVDSWGERLHEQGYRVTTVGKLHFQSAEANTGFYDQRIPLHTKAGIGDLTQAIREGMDRSVVVEDILGAGAGESEYLDYDREIATVAADILKNELPEEGKPWCLQVGFVCPHNPWKVPADLLELYKPFEKLPFPVQWDAQDRPMHERVEFLRKEMGFNDPNLTEEAIRNVVASYYALCTFVDQQIGIVVDALKASGMYENTRIVYISDHGESMGNHGVFFKNNMFESAVGIPMLMAGEGVPKDNVETAAVSLVDLFPTIIECLGATPDKKDEELPGLSLFRYYEDEKPEERPVISESHAVGAKDALFMVRYNEYKLVHFVNSTPMLYNIVKDPMELNDLAKDESYKEIVADMMAKLYSVCNPEDLDRQAKESQSALLEKHGGVEEILKKKFISHSPVPVA